MSFFSDLANKFSGGTGGQKRTDGESYDIKSIDDIAEQKSKGIKSAALKLSAFVVILFIGDVAIKSVMNYRAAVKKEANGSKKLLPEMNATELAGMRLQLANEYRMNQLEQKVDRQAQDNNKTLEEIKKLIIAQQEKTTRATASKQTEKNTYPKASLPPQKSVQYGNVNLPKEILNPKAQKGALPPRVEDFFAETKGANEQQKTLSAQQIKQADNTPLKVVKTEHQTHPIATSRKNDYSSNAYTVTIGSIDAKTENLKFDSNQSSDKTANFVMPKGTAKATLISGIDAPTLTMGEKDPAPAFLTLDSPILIANDNEANLQDCMLMGAAKGNIVTNRAIIRISDIECVMTDKKGKKFKVTSPVEGWVYSENGGYGLDGRLVSREGKIIDAAVPIMMIEAIVGAAKGASSTTTVPGLGTFTNSNGIGDNLKQGVAQGIGKPAEKMIDMYIKILDEIRPTIEVKPGRHVVVLFKGGEKLKIEKFDILNVRSKEWK